jgi:hypothetical protein
MARAAFSAGGKGGDALLTRRSVYACRSPISLLHSVPRAHPHTSPPYSAHIVSLAFFLFSCSLLRGLPAAHAVPPPHTHTHTTTTATIRIVLVFASPSTSHPPPSLSSSLLILVHFLRLSMPSLTLDGVTRAVGRFPATSALITVTLFLNVSVMLDLLDIQRFLLHSALSKLYLWDLVTYALAVPCLSLALVPLYVALFARLGSAVEAALGSAEFILYSTFTVVVTALAMVVVDKAVLFPLGWLVGTLGTPQECLTEYGRTQNLHFMYWGVWPLAQVIAFVLCRVRGGTTPVGPLWSSRRLTLQQVPLALVGCAVVCDVAGWVWFSVSGPACADDPLGWSWVLALISLFVGWLYERHTASAGNPAFALDAFFYPAGVRTVVQRAGESTYVFLRPSRLSFLLPPREAGGTAMPMPVFASNAAASSVLQNDVAAKPTTTLLPGTTAEEAERYRLIAREALARRLQESRQAKTDTTVTHHAEGHAGPPGSPLPQQQQPSVPPAAYNANESEDKTA